MKKYICQNGLEGLLPWAVNGANTIENLREYLAGDPFPEHRLVTCQNWSGNWFLVWELKE